MTLSSTKWKRKPEKNKNNKKNPSALEGTTSSVLMAMGQKHTRFTGIRCSEFVGISPHYWSVVLN